MNPSQFYIEARIEDRDEMEVEMLSSADFRSFASACYAAHYPSAKALPGEELLGSISPGEERHTSLPDTKCLLTFLVEINNSRGERLGAREFNRIVLLDTVHALARRSLRRLESEQTLQANDARNVEVHDLKYCLHYHPEGRLVQPRFKVPRVREADFEILLSEATRIPLVAVHAGDYPTAITTFMTGSVYNTLADLAMQSEIASLEEGCFLDGEILYDPDRKQFARFLTECIPALHAEKGASHVTINGDCWSHYYRARSGPGVLLAEGHSHPSTLANDALPGSSIFMSPSDRSIQRHFFWQFFQSTVIVTQPPGKELQMGVWGHADGFIVPEREAFVLPDSNAIA